MLWIKSLTQAVLHTGSKNGKTISVRAACAGKIAFEAFLAMSIGRKNFLKAGEPTRCPLARLLLYTLVTL